nr:YHYH domain-containing protein [Erwinia oleae]
MKKSILLSLLTLLFSALQAPIALAHSGRTDANGCHTNHKTGDYHCHGAGRSTSASVAVSERTDENVSSAKKSSPQASRKK